MTDAERLSFLMQCIEGFMGVEKDRYDYAQSVADENGRDLPNLDDELNGFRRLIDVAIAAKGD